MKAVQYTENTDDVTKFTIAEVDKPTASPGVAVVKVIRAAVNPIDWMVMAGLLKPAGWDMPLPFRMGYDYSGVIDSVDDADKDAFKVGDAVFGVQWGAGKHDDDTKITGGTFAEYVQVPVKKISKKPEGITHSQAAAIALVGTTAYQIVHTAGAVTKDQKVLVLGGSGTVGLLAVQFAKLAGAWVATTCSSRKKDLVSSAKPDLIIDYNAEKWDEMDSLKGIDVVIDAVGETDGFPRVQAGKVLKENGRFVTIANPQAGFDPKAHPPLEFAAYYILANSAEHQDTFASLLAKGEITLPIDSEYEFTEGGVKDLLEKCKASKAVGKLVLKVSE
eukprot:m.23467 g.23467  ORF g.23467 m.23467 type:complete len:332 (+) comp7502_c0_seq1:88-1083(+)